MPLQTDHLVMISQGILNDTPSIDKQPILPDGIHLRWMFQRDVGFPWHGYYLFRRPHEIKEPVCTNKNWIDQPPGSLSTSIWFIPEGVFRSDTDLSLTSDIGTSGMLGLDLNSRGYLQFDLPQDDPAYRIDLTIGFYETVHDQVCVDFPKRRIDQLKKTFIIDGIKFEIQAGNPPPRLPPLPPTITITATFPEPVSTANIDLTGRAGSQVEIEALDATSRVLFKLKARPPVTKPKTFKLEAQRSFQRVRLRFPQGQAILHRLCYMQGTVDERGVTITALDGATPVASQSLSFAAGQRTTISLGFDRITSVRVSTGNGVLIQLCYHPVSMGATKNWQPVASCPQPITLPLKHPDYPANLGSIDPDADWNDLQTRVIYGSLTDDPLESFRSIHEQLQALVVNGPPGPPESAMAHPARVYQQLAGTDTSSPGEQSPTIPQLHPLDLVVLGSIHPAVAQLLGLYWADTTATPAAVYDYLIVADYTGVARGDVENMLAHIVGEGFSGIDAWIVFNTSMVPGPPLNPPQRVKAYALPGGTYRAADNQPQDAQGNIGVSWQVEHDTHGYLRPGHPVMYHVWRDHRGNAETPLPNSEASEWLTENHPLLLINPSKIVSKPVNYPAGWPPFTLRYIDFGLKEGWYGYQINAVDLFGRFSAKSSFAEWWQWNPPPQPKPWYYVDPQSERVINPSSVRILDKLAPPPPLAVEAYALDPADPLLIQDQAYKDWRLTVQDTLVGLRVRWWWTAAQQRQAPDISEFRIYWHDGRQLPGWVPDETPEAAKWRDVRLWQLRCFVCPYDQQVTILSLNEVETIEQNGQQIPVITHHQGDRRYEVFLPIKGETGPFINGIPLAPALTDTVVYANVTVTAADASIHSPDRWPGTGIFAGRIGNESQPAAPQRVYRVWRQLPDPPPALAEPPRYYATAADYHNHSYFTYHWQPADDLWVHVYRALDDSVFKLDWTIRNERGPINQNNSEHQKFFPPDWDTTRRQDAATALNALNSPAAYRGLPDDALRLLAGLPGNEKAFTQLTTAPLSQEKNSWPDTLDGRATNRYFYRVAYVDKAQNRSALSLASAPLFLPDVTPPKPPVITKVVGGDREITLTWASNREPDLAEYRVYRAESADVAQDIRLMKLMHTETVAQGVPGVRPAEISWTDTTVPGLVTFYYCLVAVDDTGNRSNPSQPVAVRGYDDAPPALPTLSLGWSVPTPAATAEVSWTSPYWTRLERRAVGGLIWDAIGDWRPAGTYNLSLTIDTSTSWRFRVRVRKETNAQAIGPVVPLTHL
jgi:hypothetical protein